METAAGDRPAAPTPTPIRARKSCTALLALPHKAVIRLQEKTLTPATNRERQYSQEFQLSSPAGASLTWTLGLYGFWYKGDQLLSLYGSTLPAPTRINGIQDAESYAIYGQATKELWNGGRLTAGLRHTWEQRTLNGRFNAAPPIAELKSKYNKLSWRVALDQDIGPDALVYASYNRGFKSGAYNAGFLSRLPVRPEVLDAYEVGLKSRLLDRRLRVNLSGYYYDFSDIQLQQFINGVGALRNAAKAEVYGIDAGAELAVTRDFTLSGNFGWARSKFLAFPGANFAVPIVNSSGVPTGGNTIVSGDAAGNELPRAPRFTAAVIANYTVPVGRSDKLEFNVAYSYNDGYYHEPDNVLRQRAYSLVNARVDYHFRDHLTIGVFARNLTNTFYTTALTAQVAGDQYVASEPRVYGVSFSTDF